jgi:hypothetical protein
MNKILDKVTYLQLLVFAVMMCSIPFYPMPHFFEKLIMLKEGTLVKGIDIFDLFFHSTPLILIALKFALKKFR